MTCVHGSTLDFNRLLQADLPPEDGQDLDDALSGFIASVDHAEVRAADGRVVWSQQSYAFFDDEAAPETVNPSLW